MGRHRNEPRMDGFLDWFRGKKETTPGSIMDIFGPPRGGAMIPAVPLLPAVPEVPKKSLIERISEFAGSLIPSAPPPSTPTIFFETIKPTPRKAYEERKKEQQELWESMFGPVMPEEMPATEAPSRFAARIQKPYPGEMIVAPISEFPRPAGIDRGMPIQEWPMGEMPIWWNTRWNMPTAFDLYHQIAQKWDLTSLFETVLSNTDTQWWKETVREAAHTGEPATIWLEEVARAGDPYGDIASFLGIPEYVISAYLKNIYTEYQFKTSVERLEKEAIEPMVDRLSKALEAHRPAQALRGWFDIAVAPDEKYYLVYREAPYRPQL